MNRHFGPSGVKLNVDLLNVFNGWMLVMVFSRRGSGYPLLEPGDRKGLSGRGQIGTVLTIYYMDRNSYRPAEMPAHDCYLWLANNLSAGNDLTFRAGETKNRGSCRSSSRPCFVSCDYRSVRVWARME